MWFFVFSINFARTREGRPARRKLTERLVKSKKTLVTEPAAIFFVFQVNVSCKTTSIILYFKYASFSVVRRKKRQNTNPHPDGNFFDDRFGLGILRDVDPVDVEETRGIANVRIHVERVIGLLRRKYTILSGTLPIDFLICNPNGSQEAATPMIDRIINVCSALVNLCPGIVPFD